MNLKFKPRFKMAPEGGQDEGKGGGAQNKEAENALIEKVKASVAEQMRSIEGSEEHKKLVTDTFAAYMGKITPDQLRSVADDNNKIKLDLATISTQIEKISQRAANAAEAVVKDTNFVKELLEKRFGEIEKVINSKNAAVQFDFNLRAAEIITTQNIVDTDGLTVDDLENGLNVTDFVEKRRAREYIFEIADRTTVSGSVEKNKTWTTEGDEEGAFAIVQEGALKPMVSANLVAQASKAQKVAGHTVYTDEVPKFKREAYLIIRRLINDKLLRDYQGLLTTALLADAASYVSSALDGQYANPTDFHAIAAVAAQIEGLNFYPDVLIINPQDKWRMGMAQDQNGAFFIAIPSASPSEQPRLLGFRVVTSTKITPGNFILGESGLWKIEDETVTIKIGYGTTQIKNGQGVVTDVQDDLTHNRFRVIAELFYHSYIDQAYTGSFVYGNFDVIKALLKAPVVPEG